jgi:hypothetical protein
MKWVDQGGGYRITAAAETRRDDAIGHRQPSSVGEGG